ncbi:MAG: SH3 domain-containing protein [Methyloprofundus sp.]|nr:SH3 domain-containing protein [Methyloprofundus sp.]
MSKYKVTAPNLNLRSAAKKSSGNRIAVLTQGQVVNIINKNHAPWWLISTNLHNIHIEGYVHSNYLQAIEEFQPLPIITSIAPVHLKENHSTITRSRDGGRAFPLGEQERPQRNGSTKSERIAQLGDIIDWLDVEQNQRYLKKGSTTYCNIYAYDFCYLAGVYLPRVWWKEKALLELAQGKPVEVRYGVTVRELNANSLHDWLEDFGADFGWRPSIDVSECQHQANEGKIVLACAKRVSTNRPGHICPFVPETTINRAKRIHNGDVSRPLQSQAGGSNFRYKAVSKWWTADKFQSFGLWIHD